MLVLIGGMQKHQAIKTNGICTTLSASMGMGGGYVPMIFEVDDMKTVCERRMDEGLRTFKDDVVGTIRTIDSGVTNE